MENARASSASGALRAGARIANSRGIVGTLGCFALTRAERSPVILSCQHVLFGAGGRAREPWSLIDLEVRPAGRVRHGRRGIVRFADADTYVDCATADLNPTLQCGLRLEQNARGDTARPGAAVHMSGPGGGTVEGIVIDADYSEMVPMGGSKAWVSNQLKIRPVDVRQPFNTCGDSGAALRDASGAVVGLVWGFGADGAALACPIAPVLWLLDIHLACGVDTGAP
jgi:hypothetical protein